MPGNLTASERSTASGAAPLPDIDGYAKDQQHDAVENRFGAAAIEREDGEDKGNDLDDCHPRDGPARSWAVMRPAAMAQKA